MRENYFTSDFRRVKMANSRDPRMAKVYDKKSIYYHCVSLKKLLSQEEQALMQPLEDSLRQQDKLRPPYGECHHCHDREEIGGPFQGRFGGYITTETFL